MRGVWPIFYRELLILRSRLWRQLANYAVSPLLYIIAFGWGMGRGVTMEGVEYLAYMLPGLMALSSMSRSFGISSEINIARFYWHTFEEFQTSPISPAAIALGEVLGGMVRGLLGAVVVVCLALLNGVKLHYGSVLWLGLLVNCFMFASAAVWAAMVVRSHADQSNLTGFIITPMSFLCGTFFSLDKLPAWAAAVINTLPLTHASHFIRASALGQSPPWLSLAVMALYAAVFFAMAVWHVRKASI
ncbi:MAG: ABC transporter permease [Deltaproteobacteria bacterium]|nr:ABC transporter permease [Deltaproteobacteria bacterium]